jgi:hypothetical protein
VSNVAVFRWRASALDLITLNPSFAVSALGRSRSLRQSAVLSAHEQRCLQIADFVARRVNASLGVLSELEIASGSSGPNWG